MGTGSSVLVYIHLDRTNRVYYGGESIAGTIHLKVEKKQTQIQNVYVTLKGKGGYTTQVTKYTVGQPPYTTTRSHDVLFLKLKKDCHHRRVVENALKYSCGDYSWRFDIPLPNELPPSFDASTKYPYVLYYLKLLVERSDGSNIEETVYLTIFPCLNLLQNPQCFAATSFGSYNRNCVNFKGSLLKCGYTTGETIKGTFEIDNPERFMLKKIRLSLVQYARVERNELKEIICEICIPSIEYRDDEYLEDTFSLDIPSTQLAPSCNFHGGYADRINVSIYYSLNFHVKVEGIFSNFDVLVPITIGTESIANSCENQLNQVAHFSANSISCDSSRNIAVDHRDALPSYLSLFPN